MPKKRLLYFLFIVFGLGLLVYLKTSRPLFLSYPINAVLRLPSKGEEGPGSYLPIDELTEFQDVWPINQYLHSGKWNLVDPAALSLMKVYLAKYYQFTEEDARQLAAEFGFSGEPTRVGTSPPAYYGFVWETATEYFEVTGGTKSGGFRYYIKGTALPGSPISDQETIEMASEFLSERQVLPADASITNVLGSIASISKLSGFNEPHKQVYFRKQLDIVPVIEWEGAQSSSLMDSLEVWVGQSGRILYATNNKHFNSINYDTPDEYLVPMLSPKKAWESVENGNGRVSWMVIEGVDVGGEGFEPVPSPWTSKGKLLDLQATGVSLFYFHNDLTDIGDNFYYPVYIFSGTAILDWREGYEPSPAEENLRGRRVEVKIVHPAFADMVY